MFVPRAVDYLSTLPSGFFPVSGNDTLTITCTPGPCRASDDPKHSAAQCVAVFSSLESAISQSIKYCATLTPEDASSANTSMFGQFLADIRAGLAVCLTLLAWVLALIITIAGLVLLAFLAIFVAQWTGVSKWFASNEKSADATTTTPSPSQEQSTGSTTVEMTTLPTGETSELQATTEEDLEESASQMTDDATQWDESESAQLLVDKKTVDE